MPFPLLSNELKPAPVACPVGGRSGLATNTCKAHHAPLRFFSLGFAHARYRYRTQHCTIPYDVSSHDDAELRSRLYLIVNMRAITHVSMPTARLIWSEHPALMMPVDEPPAGLGMCTVVRKFRVRCRTVATQVRYREPNASSTRTRRCVPPVQSLYLPDAKLMWTALRIMNGNERHTLCYGTIINVGILQIHTPTITTTPENTMMPMIFRPRDHIYYA